MLRPIIFFVGLFCLNLPAPAAGLHAKRSWTRQAKAAVSAVKTASPQIALHLPRRDFPRRRSSLAAASVSGEISPFFDCSPNECDVDSVLAQMWVNGNDAFKTAAAQSGGAAATSSSSSFASSKRGLGLGRKTLEFLDSVYTLAVVASSSPDDRLSAMLASPEEVHELAQSPEGLLAGGPVLDALFPPLLRPRERGPTKSYHFIPDSDFQAHVLRRAGATAASYDYLSSLENAVLKKSKARK